MINIVHIKRQEDRFVERKFCDIFYEISGNAVLIKEINELEIKIRKLKR